MLEALTSRRPQGLHLRPGQLLSPEETIRRVRDAWGPRLKLLQEPCASTPAPGYSVYLSLLGWTPPVCPPRSRWAKGHSGPGRGLRLMELVERFSFFAYMTDGP